jgi:hypothetical protein
LRALQKYVIIPIVKNKNITKINMAPNTAPSTATKAPEEIKALTAAQLKVKLQKDLGLADPITPPQWEKLKVEHKEKLDKWRKDHADSVSRGLFVKYPSIFDDPESKEVLDKGYERYFKSGRYGLNGADLMPGQKPKSPDCLVDKKGPLTFYEVEGEADKEAHKDRNNGRRWYGKKLDALKAYLDVANSGIRLTVAGFNTKSIDPLLKVIAANPKYMSFRGLRKLVSEGKAKKDEIFKGDGLLNFLLAFQRSVSPLIKKGIKYKDVSKHMASFSTLKSDELKKLKGARISHLTLRLKERKVLVKKSKEQPTQPKVKPPVKPKVKPPVKPKVKPPVKPKVKPPVKPKVKPAVKPKVKPPVKPKVKPKAPEQVAFDDMLKDLEDAGFEIVERPELGTMGYAKYGNHRIDFMAFPKGIIPGVIGYSYNILTLPKGQPGGGNQAVPTAIALKAALDKVKGLYVKELALFQDLTHTPQNTPKEALANGNPVLTYDTLTSVELSGKNNPKTGNPYPLHTYEITLTNAQVTIGRGATKKVVKVPSVVFRTECHKVLGYNKIYTNKGKGVPPSKDPAAIVRIAIRMAHLNKKP